MITLKTLLAGIFLASIFLGFIHLAKKISCSHLFQAKAFSVLTHKLHPGDTRLIPSSVCGDILLTHKNNNSVKVRNITRSRTLKLKIEGNMLNEQISSH